MARVHLPSPLSRQRGFTLVEMLVVAPIVILFIGAFIGLIVNLTGEVMSSRGSNMLTYDIQDALNRIEDDVKQSTTFLAVNNIDVSTTKQGYSASPSPNGGTANFTNIDKSSSGGSYQSIVLNSLVTDGNPVSSQTGLVYLANQPNTCGDYNTYSKNTPMTMNVVYFVDNTNTLWRRVIMPSNYADSSARCGTKAPWQLPTCINGYNASVLTFCKTSDEKLISGVTPANFQFSYYTAASSTAADPTAANASSSDSARNTALQSTPTIAVSLSATQTIAGRTITRSATLRATRSDGNATSIAKVVPPSSVPTTPSVSGVVTDGHAVNFTWPTVSGATSYDVDYQVNGGSWVSGATGLTNNQRTYTVTQGNHTDTVTARVRANNSLGASSYGTSTITIPLWAPLIMQNGWVNYGSPYSTAAYTKTSTGAVFIKGMLSNPTAVPAGTVIAKLPADYAPSGGTLLFGTGTVGGSGRIDISSDGTIRMGFGNVGQAGYWFSLETVRYMPDGNYTRTNVSSFTNGWSNYGSGYAPASYTQDSVGRVYIQGTTKPGTLTDGTAIFALPAAMMPPQYLHIASDSTGGWSHIGINTTPAVTAKGTGSGIYSVNASYLPSSYSGWINMSLQNSWSAYAGYATPQYTKSSDGVVELKGLIKGGSTTAGANIMVLPAGYRPKQRILYTTASNAAYARVDILPTGEVQFLNGSNAWFSLDNVEFIAEQ